MQRLEKNADETQESLCEQQVPLDLCEEVVCSGGCGKEGYELTL